MEDNLLVIGGRAFHSRFFLGTGKFASLSTMREAIVASGSELVTVAVRRMNPGTRATDILDFIPEGVTLMPNTSGARTAEEAVRIARMARAAGCGDFVKIEVITDMVYLMPDNTATLEATRILAAEGFVVLPYIQPDPVLCRRLEDAGAAAVMPLGSPIGTNQGLRTRDLIALVIEQSSVPVVVDAGIGRPSHAAEAVEMGADAVLVNTAVATALNPVEAARSFALAVEAARLGVLAGLGPQRHTAEASSPLTGFLHEVERA
jgi:thiazole synthase